MKSDAFKATFITLVFLAINAGLLVAGCATFGSAAQNIPGSVQIGLSIAACVTTAFKEETDPVAREAAIEKCAHDAFGQLNPQQKRELLQIK